MIAQYLKAYPILKQALVGNLKDKLGVDLFIPILTGLNQPTLEGLIANLPHQVVMGEVKVVCTIDEQKLVDENDAWFKKLRQEMILELKGEDDEATPSSPEVPAKTP